MKNPTFCGVALAICAIIAAESAKIRDGRVTNGDVAQPGQFPWQVGVVAVRSSLLYYCGGSIIGNEWILTSARCIYEADSVLIFYGTLDLEDTKANVSISTQLIVHGSYDNGTIGNDIGLVQLSTPLAYNENVAAIFLAPGDVVYVGADVTVMGWGTTSNDDTSDQYDVLRYISVKAIADEDCIGAYGPEFIQPGMFCTNPGTPVKNPCRGDGGDPAVLFVDSKPTHVGIFSFLSSYGCDNPDFPTGFTETSSYREWIRSKTGI